MSGDYVPHADLDFANWSANFVSYVQEHAAELRVDPEELAELVAQRDAFVAAYEQHVALHTAAQAAWRTKDGVKKSFGKSLRGVAQQIQAARSIRAAHKVSLGLTVGTSTEPRPLLRQSSDRPDVAININSRLTHILTIYNDTHDGKEKKRPGSAIGCEIWRCITGDPMDPSQYEYVGLATKSTFTVGYTGEHSGATIHYILRWIGRDGDMGQWSKTHSATVAA